MMKSCIAPKLAPSRPIWRRREQHAWRGVRRLTHSSFALFVTYDHSPPCHNLNLLYDRGAGSGAKDDDELMTVEQTRLT
jgi:hypothetical protein